MPPNSGFHKVMAYYSVFLRSSKPLTSTRKKKSNCAAELNIIQTQMLMQDAIHNRSQHCAHMVTRRQNTSQISGVTKMAKRRTNLEKWIQILSMNMVRGFLSINKLKCQKVHMHLKSTFQAYIKNRQVPVMPATQSICNFNMTAQEH